MALHKVPSLLLLLLAAPLASGQDAACALDFSGDGVVATSDLLYLLAVFGRNVGETSQAEVADINADGWVGTDDLLMLLASFGDVCDTSTPAEAAVVLQGAAEEFAAAMLNSTDPFAPLVAVSSSISFDGDIGLINEDMQSRLQFEVGFAESMASSLGDGSTVRPEMVVVDDVREVQAEWEGMGRRRLQAQGTTDPTMYIQVLFHLLLPESLQSAGSALITIMQATDQQIAIAVGDVTFTADTASMAPPVVLPAVIDCEGAWVPSEDECSEPCGPNGVRPQTFVVFRAEQNGGSDCIDSETLPAPLPCNTHVQCPVDCAGDWGEWGDCSLPCGNGTQTRSFVVLQEPQHGGAECPDHDTSQSQACNVDPCPPPPPVGVDCVGSWSAYGECSHPCGPDGLQQRTFTVSQVASNGGAACTQAAGDMESQSCNTHVQCSVDCEGEWLDFGPCSAVCGPGNRTREFRVASPAENGGSCPEEGTTETQACDNLCPAALSETDVDPGPIALPVSGAFELATLIRVAGQTGARGSMVPVARSYNGNEWEGTMPSPVSFECTATPPVTCSTTLPDGATYQLRTYDGTSLISQDPKVIASRFLSQTTFGPKMDEIESLSAPTVEETEAAIEQWLYTQMEMEPNLHRAYLRRRTNPQAYNMPQTMMRPPCSEASSWVTFAFSRFDEGKQLDVSLNADGSYSLSIEGIVRTVVQSTKDIREDIEWSCYKRGFRTPLDMPGTSPTVEVSVQACHQRCVSTDGCGYFSLNEDTMECHLQETSASPLRGEGGAWRSGPADCSLSTYQYPPVEVPGADSGLQNMGASCWGQCGAHGPCPGRCGANGYCCKFGRDINGCVTTDPTATTHRCIPDPSMPAPPPAPAPRLLANTTYTICLVQEYEGGDVSLLLPGIDYPGFNWGLSSCGAPGQDQIILGNPPVNLLEPDMFITQQLEAIEMVAMPLPLVNAFSLRNIAEPCELPANPTVFIFHGEKYYRHEPRSQLVENTVDSPYSEERIIYQRDREFISSLTPTFCPAARPSFTNARGCVRQSSCAQPEWTEGNVTLDAELMRSLFTKSQKYVYAVTGFSLEGISNDEISACSVQTRWKKSPGSCDADTPLDDGTLASLSAALQQVPVEGPAQTELVLETADIIIIEAVLGDCTTELNGVSIVGAKVTLDGTCYEQVHPQSYDVYDIAYWRGRLSGEHTQYGGVPGGDRPLTRPATLGQTELDLTSVCADLSCWPTRWNRNNPTPLVRYMGVLGAQVEFSSLPTTVQVPWLAEMAGVEDISVDPGVSESCGSIGEVANDPMFGHKYGGRGSRSIQRPSYWPKAMMWQNAVFHAEDQLRQRVAWALSQIYVVADVGFAGNMEVTAKYYDIFLRNAFGNFRNLIKEVAYSESMAIMLTYLNSKSAKVSGDFADENFARECIQLFTAGTEHLNLDGTPVLDDDGNRVATYGVSDVASFARAWTGFVSTGNDLRSNRIGATDTLKIVAGDRDASPKMDLFDGFIGDGLPACVDLPKRAFLRKGFSYAYRGDTTEHLPADEAGAVSVATLDDPSSPLFQALCDPVRGDCTFPGEVSLEQSLPCSGPECDWDRAPYLRVVDGSGRDAYYEGIDFACARFPFFEDGQFVKYGAPFVNTMSCSDPRSAAAAPLCCSNDATDGQGTAMCEYKLERVTYANAAHRCATTGKDVCQGNAAMAGWETCHPLNQWRFSTWMGRTCSTQVQIQRDGRVSVVHAGELVDNSALNWRIQPETVADVLAVGSKSVFDVLWSQGSFPKAADGCSSSCTVVDDTCLCDVEAVSSAAFTDSSRIPTVSEVSDLHVGALDPTAYDDGEYFRCTSELCSASEVGVWSRRMRMHEALAAEIEEVNLALDKPVTSSSNYGASQNAFITDGTTDDLYHSECTGEQWAQIDLEEVTRIDAVKIWHRTDCCGTRINGGQILISDTDDFSTGVQCGDTLAHANPATLNLCSGMSGRYVTVRLGNGCLQLKEVEVLTEAIQTPDGYVYSPDFYEFTATSDDLVYNTDTIFEVPTVTGSPKFLKNEALSVLVDDSSFRNPPTIMDFEHPTLRQAELETDAVLDHLTTHPSTAPFICRKIMQLLTSSNPSPRYVLEVVTAFRTGEYGGRVYSGEYGDLGAAIAAIFLDREARDLTLDLDPAAGKVREPLLKLMHAFRSLEFIPSRGMEIEMSHLITQIGQQAYRQPSVFNFYLPDYSPAGAVAKAGLYAPEAEILTTPFVIGYMNGMAALVDDGLAPCNGGFGYNTAAAAPRLYLPTSCTEQAAKRMTSNGVLTYEYQNRAGDVVSELALLLTNGREPAAVRNFWERSQVQWVNLARNRPTSASSEWHTGCCGSLNVVDGLTDGPGIFHSACSGEQYVQVDLGGVVAIDNVQVFHRMDCCGDRINGGTVLVSDTPDFSAGTQCAAPLVFTGDPVSTLSCPGTSGRYVTVRQEGQCLHFQELQVNVVRDGVIGEPVCSYVPPRGDDTAVAQVPDGSVALGQANWGALVQGTRIEDVTIPLDYEIGLDITPGATVNGNWASIVHFTATGTNCCEYGSRIPGVWFWPRTRKILVVDGHGANGNSHTGEWGCDEALLTLPEGVTSTLRMIMEPDTVSIYINGNLACTEPRADRAVYASVESYMSDPWHEAADVTVENLYLSGTNAAILSPPEPSFLTADPNGVSTCNTTVTALEDDAACVAAGCHYTPGLPTAPVPSEADLLPELIKLFTFSSEYATTNQNVLRDHPRPALPEIPTQNRPYKAIVVIFLEGGADSFNMLIPHSGCVRDLYAEYAQIRSNIALPLGSILPMELHAESPPQPCTTYGTHPALTKVKELWDAGQASWFANIGTLIAPLTREDFLRQVNRPTGLFGHDTQQKEAQSVHAQNKGASGVLGRIMDALTTQENPYRSKVYSMYGIRKLVEGAVPPTVIGGGGVVRFSQYDSLGSTLHELTGRESESIYADTYAGILEDALSQTERLGAQLAAINLQGDYSGDTGMQQIAKVMSLDHSVHESERDVFMIGIRTFDAHQNPPHMDINMLLGRVNRDLIALHTDLVALDLWDATTIVSISDFGRTISSNGIGTDHAWGGNNFILGGSVKGRRVHGVYPEDLNPETSDLEVGRGRGIFIPTTPWEGMWYGLAQWFGVVEDRILDVVPNVANFPDSALHSQDELFN